MALGATSFRDRFVPFVAQGAALFHGLRPICNKLYPRWSSPAWQLTRISPLTVKTICIDAFVIVPTKDTENLTTRGCRETRKTTYWQTGNLRDKKLENNAMAYTLFNEKLVLFEDPLFRCFYVFIYRYPPRRN